MFKRIFYGLAEKALADAVAKRMGGRYSKGGRVLQNVGTVALGAAVARALFTSLRNRR